MGNHDLYDTPEDIAREEAAEAFQKKVETVHDRLRAMNAGKFTVDELDYVINVLRGQGRGANYTPTILTHLEELEKKVTAPCGRLLPARKRK